MKVKKGDFVKFTKQFEEYADEGDPILYEVEDVRKSYNGVFQVLIASGSISGWWNTIELDKKWFDIIPNSKLARAIYLGEK